MAIANVGTGPGYYTFTCGGAQIRAHCRHLATVVTVRGEVDSANVDQVGEHLRRLILGENPVVLDMSDVRRFAAPGIWLFFMLDEQCRAAGLEWTLVASPAVIDVLSDHCGEDGAKATFPITDSVHQALRDLADAIASRRRLMLSLVGKTA